jgi:hypothetical protein
MDVEYGAGKNEQIALGFGTPILVRVSGKTVTYTRMFLKPNGEELSAPVTEETKCFHTVFGRFNTLQ